MAEFRVGEHSYRSRKLNLRQQWHVFRRLGPVMGPIAHLLTMQPPDPNDTEAIDRQMDAIMPFLNALARMPEEDVNYVLSTCLAVTQRAQGGNGAGPVAWADVWNAAAGREMFEDIDFGVSAQIVWNVIQENLAGFSSIRPLPMAAQDTVQPPTALTSPG